MPKMSAEGDSGDLYNKKGLLKAKEFSRPQGMKLRKWKVKLTAAKLHGPPLNATWLRVRCAGASQDAADLPEHSSE